MPSCHLRKTGECDLTPDCSGWKHDGEAWAYLEKRGFTAERFLVSKPNPDHELTDEEYSAVCYLIREWDWGYEGVA